MTAAGNKQHTAQRLSKSVNSVLCDIQFVITVRLEVTCVSLYSFQTALAVLMIVPARAHLLSAHKC
jgi:hypothetical protein